MQTESERIAAAKAALAPTQNIAYSPDVSAAKGPSADELAQAYADQSGVVPPSDQAGYNKLLALQAKPTTSAQPEQDSTVVSADGGTAARNVPSLDQMGGTPQKQIGGLAINPNGSVQGEGTAKPYQQYNAENHSITEGAGGSAKATEADRIAAARAKLVPLDATRSLEAANRLNAPAQGRAVLVSPGGMRPSTEALKVERGPQVAGAQDLLHDIESQGTKSAADNATAELKRDTTLAGLQEQNTANTAKFAGAEAKIGQANSDKLSGVADRMQAAIDRAKIPVVSPAQDLNEMGIGQKIAFALAAAGGGIAGRANGTNPFLQGFDDMVNARIKTQMQQVEQAKGQASDEQNLYGVLRKGFDDDNAARTGLRVMYLQAFNSKLEEARLHYNIDSADPRYLALQAGISQQLLTEREKLAQLEGQRVSEETTKKYVPPQVAVVGGDSKSENANRSELHEKLLKEGLLDRKADLDALNNVVRNVDKNGLVRQWIDSHPGSSTFDAIAGLSADPTQKQFVVDLQRNMKEELGDKGMRSEGGQKVIHSIDNPAMAQQLYNRWAHDYADRTAAVIDSVPDGWGVYNRSLAHQQDIKDAPNTPVNPIGSEALPSSIPNVTDPPPVPPQPIATGERGSRKKREK